MPRQIVTLDIVSLLNGDQQYSIPEYQRNYAWREEEISQLISDIIDYIPLKGEAPQDYYLGTLVVYERKQGPAVINETIDGQQRLTTLSLLMSAIRHMHPEISMEWFKKINLEFANRKTASQTLQYIYNYDGDFKSDYEWNEGIVNGYELCKKLLDNKLNENNVSIQQFTEYLFKSVKILRVSVPEDTDLNHYFEIMNNRGEQLEKHEILKSKFLELLNALDGQEKGQSIYTFNLVWEACSNMEKYVQYGFSIEQRNRIFGKDDWNTFLPSDFFELSQHLKDNNDQGKSLIVNRLSSIIEGRSYAPTSTETDDAPDRFNSVINFPNFLLHALRIYTKKDIPLDDKRLILLFDDEIKKASDKVQFAQDFGYHLLHCKFLFDKYIIKREFLGGVDRWSLKRLKWYKDNKVSYVNSFGSADDDYDDDNRSILMLLSMFHVSTPTLVYKHWLNAALLYVVSKQGTPHPKAYKNYLISLARSFVFDRFLCNDIPTDYFTIIYNSTGTIVRGQTQINIDKLRYGNIENNLLFNYLDFLLWEEYKPTSKQVRQYEFSFRSSVEHYYPRNPMPGYKPINTNHLDSFGNLCLISHSKNSRLSNQPPIAKKSHYKTQGIDSIKQWVMMEHYDADAWNEQMIVDHGEKMIRLLSKEMNSEFDIDLSSAQAVGHNSENKAVRWFNQYKFDPDGRSLLGRALMCFGDIAVKEGSGNYMDGWHPKFALYSWDAIQTKEAFTAFKEYVEINKPAGLNAIIQDQLAANKKLNADAYRKVFILHPEIWQYCTKGMFTWVNDGEVILLHEKEKNTDNGSLDLYILLLGSWFGEQYKADINYWREGFRVAVDYNRELECFEFLPYGEGKGELLVDCEEVGKIRCNIKPYRNDTKSLFVQKLIDFGWQSITDNFYQRGGTATLTTLGEDYEMNFQRAKERLEFIIKNGLSII